MIYALSGVLVKTKKLLMIMIIIEGLKTTAPNGEYSEISQDFTHILIGILCLFHAIYST